MRREGLAVKTEGGIPQTLKAPLCATRHGSAALAAIEHVGMNQWAIANADALRNSQPRLNQKR